MTLQISEKLGLPDETVTATMAALGKKGKGKTFFLGVLEEEFAKKKIPFTVIDPMGAHWGIKEKYQVFIFGGEHADVPLDPTLGSEIADLTIDSGMSNILDIREFSEAAQRKFVTDFARRLMERNRTPRHVILEEADKFLPQEHFGELAAVYHQCDEIVRRGRQFGLGVTVATQRPAKISKDTTSQCDAFFFFGLVGTTDRQAVKDFLEGVAEPSQIKEIYGRLPQLPPGSCIVYSPEWLKVREEIHIRQRETFHAGRTPKLGDTEEFRAVPVDAAELKNRMEALIANKAEEEGELARLRRQNEKLAEDKEKLEKRLEIRDEIKGVLGEPLMKIQVGPRGTPDKIEPVVLPEQIKEIEKKYGDMLGALQSRVAKSDLRVQELEREKKMLEPYLVLASAIERVIADKVPVRDLVNPGGEPMAYNPTGTTDYQLWYSKLKGPSLKIFQFLLQHKAKKFNRSQLALGAGYSPTSGSLKEGLAELRRIGLLQSGNGEFWLQ